MKRVYLALLEGDETRISLKGIHTLSLMDER